jgi:hypothetical protein
MAVPLSPPTTAPLPWGRFLALVFVFIFAARVWLVGQFGASVALVDEWQAIGGEILAPWREGTLTWSALFQAHNGDHRIVATRLFEILLFTMNGAWDPLLSLTAKAAVYAAATTIFVHLLVGRLTERRAWAGLLLAGLFAFPFSYQNLFWAFQSQFDFFLLAVALGWLALLADRLLVAAVMAAAALFTLGAGPILAASFLPWLALRWVREPAGRRRLVATMVAATAIFAVGISLRSGDAAPSGSAAGRLATLASELGWPYSNLVAFATSPKLAAHLPAAAGQVATLLEKHESVRTVLNLAFAAVILLPLGALAHRLIRLRCWPPAAWGPLALGLFALLMAIATALARADNITVAARYLDLVVLIGFSSLASAFVLAGLDARWRRRGLIWALAMAPGFFVMMGGTLLKLQQRLPAYWLHNLQAYFPAHDHAVLSDNRDSRWPILESDSVPAFMAFLDDPRMAEVLPRSLTRPEAPLPTGSALAFRVRQFGAPVALAAGAGLLGLAWRSRRRRAISGDPAMANSDPVPAGATSGGG